ncbi:MAG: hypothetical protein M0Z50_19230 [Planctomycetia bacterium]|nr:hypothetical protein [Planctomycetia bacterium]
MVSEKVKFTALVEAIDGMIERLSDRLLPSDRRHGWDEKSQAAMTNIIRISVRD